MILYLLLELARSIGILFSLLLLLRTLDKESFIFLESNLSRKTSKSFSSLSLQPLAHYRWHRLSNKVGQHKPNYQNPTLSISKALKSKLTNSQLIEFRRSINLKSFSLIFRLKSLFPTGKLNLPCLLKLI